MKEVCNNTSISNSTCYISNFTWLWQDEERPKHSIVVKKYQYKREILVDWLSQVNTEFEFQDITLFTAIDLLDRILSKKRVKESELQLVGCVVMLISCKIHEKSPCKVKDFVYISDNSITSEQIVKNEFLLVNKYLHWRTLYPTTYHFIAYFCNMLPNIIISHDLRKFNSMLLYLAYSTLQQNELIQFKPYIVALSCINIATGILPSIETRSTICKYSRHLFKLTDKDNDSEELQSISSCSTQMLTFLNTFHSRKYNHVYCKFIKTDFFQVALTDFTPPKNQHT